MAVIKCSAPTVTRTAYHWCNKEPVMSCLTCEKTFCVYHAKRHNHLSDLVWKYQRKVWYASPDRRFYSGTGQI